MKKYWHVIGIGIQNNLTYRFNYLTRTLFSFIPLFAMLSLWRTIYAGKGQGSALGGYTQAEMIFYYMQVKADVRQPLVFASVLAVLLGWRLVQYWQRPKPAPATAPAVKQG